MRGEDKEYNLSPQELDGKMKRGSEGRRSIKIWLQIWARSEGVVVT